MTTGRKLAIAGCVVAGVTGYMAYVGASASWQYYQTVDECLAGAAARGGDRIRVSGKIAAGSLRIDAEHRQISFALEGTAGNLPVLCTAAPPENLAEGIEVVVEGRMERAACLRGERILTRCASKYKSRATAVPSPSDARGAPEGS